MDAFEVEAFDYLLKPFDLERFQNVMERVKEKLYQDKKIALSENVRSLYQDLEDSVAPHLTNLEIKEKGLIRKIKLKDVISFESSSVYVEIQTNNRTTLYRTSMNLMEQQISPQDFVRIHRSTIINKNQVSNMKYLNNSTFLFLMRNGRELISSRSYFDRINKAFG